MTIRSAAWKSGRCVLLGSAASWAIIFLWPSLSPAVATIADGLFWSVPFVLATSLATFNNTLRIFDRIEEMVKGDLLNLPQNERARLTETVKSTATLTGDLMWNALIVILAGITYLVIGAFLSVPSPRWLPSWIEVVRPDLVGTAVRFGLGALATRILILQFQAIPPMVEFYKFFTVDRHRLRRATGENEADEVKTLQESCSRS